MNFCVILYNSVTVTKRKKKKTTKNKNKNLIISINKDAFSHSWKLILARLWPKMSPALCIMVQFVPHKPQTSLIVCDFEKEDCLGVALTLLKLLDSSLI